MGGNRLRHVEGGGHRLINLQADLSLCLLHVVRRACGGVGVGGESLLHFVHVQLVQGHRLDRLDVEARVGLHVGEAPRDEELLQFTVALNLLHRHHARLQRRDCGHVVLEHAKDPRRPGQDDHLHGALVVERGGGDGEVELELVRERISLRGRL
eukprot:CAMPEP_0206047230 /NCGR_PEP_ID=MMETSP1466-20131121/20736_1 /ASSEMBLY_ACC=CAM_ASM_001126 /TAXON_ID=44452 /ORGANISM="Pavlova gyrans, Strain CCMP608" /LENGTH=153 /DNA_ID=CAMNT_0053422241 /DNA_START=620 /DNA_END=1081 /DNA_ORIENTATION=-